MSEQKLLARRAIVTGAASGIGYGIAQRFLAEGALVIITDIDHTQGMQAAAELGGECEFIHHDVSREDDWQKIFERAREKFSVNCNPVTISLAT